MIRLHIDELVLHGFDPRDRDAIANAIRTELAQRFAKEPARDRESIARIVGRPLTLTLSPLGGERGNGGGAR